MTCARAGKHGSNPDLSTAVCSQQEKLPAPSKAVRSTWTAQHRAHTMQTMLLLSTTARSAMHAHALHSPGNVSTAALWGGSTYTCFCMLCTRMCSATCKCHQSAEQPYYAASGINDCQTELKSQQTCLRGSTTCAPATTNPSFHQHTNTCHTKSAQPMLLHTYCAGCQPQGEVMCNGTLDTPSSGQRQLQPNIPCTASNTLIRSDSYTPIGRGASNPAVHSTVRGKHTAHST
jgi:hypothetical protein